MTLLESPKAIVCVSIQAWEATQTCHAGFSISDLKHWIQARSQGLAPTLLPLSFGVSGTRSLEVQQSLSCSNSRATYQAIAPSDLCAQSTRCAPTHLECWAFLSFQVGRPENMSASTLEGGWWAATSDLWSIIDPAQWKLLPRPEPSLKDRLIYVKSRCGVRGYWKFDTARLLGIFSPKPCGFRLPASAVLGSKRFYFMRSGGNDDQVSRACLCIGGVNNLRRGHASTETWCSRRLGHTSGPGLWRRI